MTFPLSPDQGHDYGMVAQLKPGVSIEQAHAEMASVLAEIRQDLPGHLYPEIAAYC